jgi:hypothetical protein
MPWAPSGSNRNRYTDPTLNVETAFQNVSLVTRLTWGRIIHEDGDRVLETVDNYPIFTRLIPREGFTASDIMTICQSVL